MSSKDIYEVVCTGGGAKNQFLFELINEKSHIYRFVRPDTQLIDFKEAILFGFLGIKFIENMPNCSLGIGGILVKGQQYIN